MVTEQRAVPPPTLRSWYPEGVRLAALLLLVSGCDKIFLDGAVPLDMQPDVDPRLPCPPGFNAGGYALGNQRRTWREAQASCESLRTSANQRYSYLAIISDLATEPSTLNAVAGGAEYWVGLSSQTDVFSWINGEATMIPWGANEPDRSGVACGRMSQLGINDKPCEIDLELYICECSHISLKRNLFE